MVIGLKTKHKEKENEIMFYNLNECLKNIVPTYCFQFQSEPLLNFLNVAYITTTKLFLE